MDNGNAFQGFIEDAVAFLQQLQVIDYYQESLPGELDERLAAMVDRLMAATPTERERFQQALAPGQRSFFGIFGHRAATLAMRYEDRGWLLRGLVGTAVANYTIPPKRNVEVALAVFHHVARKLGVNTVDLFDEAAAFGDEAIAAHLRTFGRRSNVRLGSYGWREVKTSEGVKYQFSW